MSMEGITLKKLGDIKVGDKAWFSKTVTEADIMMEIMRLSMLVRSLEKL